MTFFINAEIPQRKLSLLYKVNSLSFLMKHAGGYASDGYRSAPKIEPASLHHRAPIFIGTTNLVRKAEAYIRDYDS